MQTNSTSKRELREKVREAYSNAADSPEDSHPFPVKFHFASSLGYPAELLRSLTQTSVNRFTGVSNVSVYAEIPARVYCLRPWLWRRHRLTHRGK
jgi:hypothetical protein